jgi:hypothetical protein
MVIIHLVQGDSTQDLTLSYDDATAYVIESRKKGYMAFDKNTGKLIYELSEGVKEIFVIGMVSGG